MKWCLTSEEAEKLRGLDVYAQLMYTSHFRRFVNFKTGLYDYRMSTQGWKELLAFEPERGSNRTSNGLPNEGKGKKFENFLAARKKQLIRAGLLVKLDSYAYQLPLIAAFSVKEEQAIESSSKQPEKALETPLNQHLSNAEELMSKGMNQPPQVFNNNKQTHSDDAYFEITVDWKPSSDFSKLALLSGFDIQQDDKALYQTALANFLLYWSSPEAIDNTNIQTSRSQQTWERRLIEDLKYHSSNTVIKPVKTAPKAKPTNNNNATEINPVIDKYIAPENQQVCQKALNSLQNNQVQDVLEVFSDVVNNGKVKSSSAGLFVTLCKKAREGALIKNEEQSTPTHESHAIVSEPEQLGRTPADIKSDIAMLEMTARFSRITVKQAAENLALLNIHEEAKQFGIMINNWEQKEVGGL